MSFIRQWALRALLVSCLGMYVVSAAAIVSTVGDQDALGTGTQPGANLPLGPFDNRSAAELVAVDGSESTDRASSDGGLLLDVEFFHTFALASGQGIRRVVLELGIGGLQSNDTDPSTSLLGEDALRIDGTLVPEAFAGIDQGTVGYGILTILLPTFVLPQFNDGEARVSIDLNSNAGLGISTRSEPVFYDFSRLTITQIPEPSTAVLLMAGVALFLWRRR